MTGIKASTIVLKPASKEKQSKILRYMSNEERADLESELFANEDLMGDHPLFNPKSPRSNVLKHGKSLHIFNIDFDGNILEDHRDLFPKTLHHIFSWVPWEDPKNLGRTYWHRLQPGQRIELHHDNSNGYFRGIHRYHTYLDVPYDFMIMLDAELWNLVPGKELTNAVIDFALLDWHYFINHTNRNMYMMVFDFYPS